MENGFESPDYVRTSLAAAMTMGMIPGRFLRNCKLYCINLLLTYDSGCSGRCAYCGLSRARQSSKPWSETSFIRVDWPIVALDDVISRMNNGLCPHVERICISMITNRSAREDTLRVVSQLHQTFDSISTLITPTIIDKTWISNLKMAGSDMVGIAIDTATPELFERFRGKGVQGPHRWGKYWATVKEAVDVFGKNKVGLHLIVGLGETEEEMVKIIQQGQDMGAKSHLFSFYPEAGSPLQDHAQPPLEQYRRMQLARYLINNDIATADNMVFDEEGHLKNIQLRKESLHKIIDSGSPFLTSGCSGQTKENACNRPFANCTPYQASIGELRNYPFQPNADDIQTVRRQLGDISAELLE